MAEHAILSPSAAYRWLACTPSARLEELEPEQPSAYAKEGSCAHAIAAREIKRRLGWDTAKEDEEIAMLAMGERYDIGEMEEHAIEWAEEICFRIEKEEKRGADPKLMVEQSLDLSSWAPRCHGTADAVIVARGSLHVLDYKYGKGVKVEAERNPQMMLYALGAIEALDFEFGVSEVHMAIVQPRLGHVSTWRVSAAELTAWGAGELRDKAFKAYAGRGECQEGDHCRFCRAAGRCKALASRIRELCLSDPALMDERELAEAWRMADTAARWAEAAKDAALRKALQGGALPGLKLVRAPSRRRIADMEGAATAMLEAGYEEKDVLKPWECKPITELERLLGKDKFLQIVGPFVDKPQGKPCLAPVDDKRKAIEPDAPLGVKEMFEGIE